MVPIWGRSPSKRVCKLFLFIHKEKQRKHLFCPPTGGTKKMGPLLTHMKTSFFIYTQGKTAKTSFLSPHGGDKKDGSPFGPYENFFFYLYTRKNSENIFFVPPGDKKDGSPFGPYEDFFFYTGFIF